MEQSITRTQSVSQKHRDSGAEAAAERAWFECSSRVACVIVLVIGTTVIAGWYTHCSFILHVVPGWVAMAYNTALGFVMSGISIFALTLPRRRYAIITGLLGCALGIATMAEYLLPLHIDLDQLFMRDYTWASVASPGRMAFCAALSFTLVGIVALVNQMPGGAWRDRATGILGSVVVGLGVVAISGYFAGVSTSYQWGQLTRMAIHTGGGFIILGSGIVALALSRMDNESGRSVLTRLPDWIPGLVGISAATATLCLWQALYVDQREQITIITRLARGDVGAEFSALITSRLLLTNGALIFGLCLSVLLAGVAYLAQEAARNAESAESMNGTLAVVNHNLAIQVTETKQAEEALRIARDQLESRVHERTAELASANRNLEEAYDAMRVGALRQRMILRDILASVTEGKLVLCDAEDDLPSPPMDMPTPIILTRADIRTLRYRTSELAEAAEIPTARANDLITAVSEAAMNAVVHGGGGQGQAYGLPGGIVHVWIKDHGNGIDMNHLHQATLQRGFTTAGSFGHGFWLMLQLVDRVWLLTGSSGTTIVLEQLSAPSESFLSTIFGLAA